MNNLSKILILTFLSCSLSAAAEHPLSERDEQVFSSKLIDHCIIDDIEYAIWQNTLPPHTSGYGQRFNYFAEVSNGAACSGYVKIPSTIHYANPNYHFGGENYNSDHPFDNLEYLDHDLSVRYIHTDAFKDNDKITKVTLPATCYALEDGCFAGCTSLREVEGFCPADERDLKVATIGEGAFKQCSALTYFNRAMKNDVFAADAIFDSLPIGKEAFAYTGLRSVMLKDASPGQNAFEGSDVEYIVLSNTVLSNNAFRNCAALNCIKAIGPMKSLDSNVYPFSDCDNLKCLDYHDYDLTEQRRYGKVSIEYNDLRLSDRLEEINIYYYSANNATSTGHCGVSANNINLCPGFGTFNIALEKSYVQQIKFDGCNRIGTLRVDYANVSPIISGANVGTLIYAYGNTIWENTLSDANVEKLVLHDNIKKIESSNLEYCNIDAIICQSSAPPVLQMKQTSSTSKVFDTPVYVPKGAVSAYKKAANWKNFKNILEEDGTIGIDDVASEAADTPAEIYSLDGRRMTVSRDALTPGIYIMRHADGRTSKIAIR